MKLKTINEKKSFEEEKIKNLNLKIDKAYQEQSSIDSYNLKIRSSCDSYSEGIGFIENKIEHLKREIDYLSAVEFEINDLFKTVFTKKNIRTGERIQNFTVGVLYIVTVAPAIVDLMFGSLNLIVRRIKRIKPKKELKHFEAELKQLKKEYELEKIKLNQSNNQLYQINEKLNDLENAKTNCQYNVDMFNHINKMSKKIAFKKKLVNIKNNHENLINTHQEENVM